MDAWSPLRCLSYFLSSPNGAGLFGLQRGWKEGRPVACRWLRVELEELQERFLLIVHSSLVAIPCSRSYVIETLRNYLDVINIPHKSTTNEIVKSYCTAPSSRHRRTNIYDCQSDCTPVHLMCLLTSVHIFHARWDFKLRVLRRSGFFSILLDFFAPCSVISSAFAGNSPGWQRGIHLSVSLTFAKTRTRPLERRFALECEPLQGRE